MPRAAVRRKASEKGDNNDDGAPGKKKRLFTLPIPTRPSVVGKALICGQGECGQLGLGNDDAKYERKRPDILQSISNVVDVAAGGMHSIVLVNDGSIFTFGCNDEGTLGRDSSEEDSDFEPKIVELPGKAVRISAGDSHTACLLEDGRVFAWGSFRDSHGNMGLTAEGNERLPIDVMPGVTCCDIASGSDHLVMLSCSGKVFTVGCGEQGQLGRVTLRSASGKGRRGKTELLCPGEVIVKRARPIEKIWATNFGTFLRESENGNIHAFGLNNYKQLLYDKTEETVVINPRKTDIVNVKAIAGGGHHTLVLKEDGSCYAVGRYDYGRLGLGKISDHVEKMALIKFLADEKVVNVACGEAVSFAITEDGKLYSWGMGSNHQLGTGSEDDVLEPAQVVSKHTQGKRMIGASGGGQHSIFLAEEDDMQSTTAKQKPAVTKKAAAAAKERESKKVLNPLKDVAINGEAKLSKPDDYTEDKTIESAALEAVKPLGKPSRKKK